MKNVARILSLPFLFLLVSCFPGDIDSIGGKNMKKYDNPASTILRGLVLPEGKDLFLTSGLVSAPMDENAPEGSRERHGDTYQQSIGTLERIKELLAEEGLGMEDIVFLRVYIAPDPELEGSFDFDAWFKAYGEYFNNEENPEKTARTTLGVAALARPYLFVEVEAIAAYPN